MRGFFKTWRREIGCVTLVMALMFMGAWVRSHSFYDLISIPTDKEATGGEPPMGWYLASTNGFLLTYSGNADIESKWPLPKYYNARQDDDPVSPYDGCMEIQFDFLGVGAGTNEVILGGTEPKQLLYIQQMFFVSYWSIVIPLTVLSAFLLLSKPRPSTEKKITEPTENEGGGAAS